MNNCLLALYVSVVGYVGILLLRADYRRRPVLFLPVYYTVLVLFRTLRGRYWEHPFLVLSKGWGMYDSLGELTLEGPLNIIMFVPFGLLINVVKQWKIRHIVGISFAFSLFIETTQVVFHRGTFQIADLFYNTLGGMIGGVLYCGYKKLRIKYE